MGIQTQFDTKLWQPIFYVMLYCKYFFGTKLVKISFSSKRTIRAQFGQISFNLKSHELPQRFSLKHFNMMRHNRQPNVTLVSFPQKSSFSRIRQFELNLAHKYRALYLTNCCRNFYKHFSMVGCISQIFLILVNVCQKSFF